MSVDATRPWPKLSPVQRFGPLLAVVVLVVYVLRWFVLKGE